MIPSRFHRFAFAALAALACLTAMGCNSLGLTEPKTFRDDYVYAINQVTAVRDSATQLLERRAISIKDAEYVLNTSREARGYLDTAKSLPDGDLLPALAHAADAVADFHLSSDCR